MKRTTGTFTTEELLHELASVQQPKGEGQTTDEMVASTGLRKAKVMALLRLAKEQGRLRVSRRLSEGIDGRAFPQTVYRISTAKGGGK